MKYGSSEFKGSTVGAVKRTPPDGDVSQSFMALESFLCFFPVLLMSSQREPLALEPLNKEERRIH